MTTLTTTDAPAAIVTNAQREVIGVRLDGTVYPLTVLRRALRGLRTAHAVAQALGIEDARDEAAIVARVRELAGKP